MKRSLPLVTSLDKVRPGTVRLHARTLSPFGIFTNDALFSRLGLTIPQTFSQLLDVCQKAKAAGTAAVIFGGADGPSVTLLITDLAVATVYGKDTHWAGELRAGKVTFDGTPGWQQALQEFIEMNDAGCFEPGATGTTRRLGGRAVRAGAGPDARRTSLGRRARSTPTSPQFTLHRSIRSRAGPTRTRRRPIVNLNQSVERQRPLERRRTRPRRRPSSTSSRARSRTRSSPRSRGA